MLDPTTCALCMQDAVVLHNEILRAVELGDLTATLTILMENHEHFHKNASDFPELFLNRHSLLRSLIKTHGLFKSMLDKKDLVSFINEVPHSMHFFNNGYQDQYWIPLRMQSQYYTGDVVLLGNPPRFVECKTLNSFRLDILRSISLNENSPEVHNIGDPGVENTEVKYKTIESLELSISSYDAGELSKIEASVVANTKLGKAPGFSFLVGDLDLSKLREYVRHTAHVKPIANDVLSNMLKSCVKRLR